MFTPSSLSLKGIFYLHLSGWRTRQSPHSPQSVSLEVEDFFMQKAHWISFQETPDLYFDGVKYEVYDDLLRHCPKHGWVLDVDTCPFEHAIIPE